MAIHGVPRTGAASTPPVRESGGNFVDTTRRLAGGDFGGQVPSKPSTLSRTLSSTPKLPFTRGTQVKPLRLRRREPQERRERTHAVFFSFFFFSLAMCVLHVQLCDGIKCLGGPLLGEPVLGELDVDLDALKPPIWAQPIGLQAPMSMRCAWVLRRALFTRAVFWGGFFSAWHG